MLKYIVVFFMLFAMACDDAVTPPATFRGVCADIGSYFCQRADECGLEPYGLCFPVFMQTCCEDNNLCNQVVDYIDDGEWDSCLSALEDVSCSAVGSGTIPPACIQAVSQ